VRSDISELDYCIGQAWPSKDRPHSIHRCIVGCLPPRDALVSESVLEIIHGLHMSLISVAWMHEISPYI